MSRIALIEAKPSGEVGPEGIVHRVVPQAMAPEGLEGLLALVEDAPHAISEAENITKPRFSMVFDRFRG